MLVVTLGRQPNLSLAELEARLGSGTVKPINNEAALLTTEEIDHRQFGGIIKVAKVLAVLENSGFRQAMKYIEKSLPEQLEYFPSNKVPLGISTYGFDIPVKEQARACFGLKRALKGGDKSLRIIESQSHELNTAQVQHNRLLDKGLELILVRQDNNTILAQTISLQDIEAYAARDQARPSRDARVGMLPPKLAQIIINLAIGKRDTSKPVSHPPVVLDPFCGTGVILQESLLMDYHASGSDIDKRMIEFSQKNIDWLRQQGAKSGFLRTLDVADATTHKWQEMNSYDAIASETYLGRPFSAPPKPDVLQKVMRDVDTIHRKFLQNVARQTQSGFRLCLAVPAWKTGQDFKHLPVLDSLEELGYTRLSFVHSSSKDLVYHREGQIVGRELVVLTRNK